jgi:hypothetical protein
MRPRRRGRQYRYSARSAGQEAALRHIEQARAFSLEIGGTDADVKRYFFSLSGPVLDEIFLAYSKTNGKKLNFTRDRRSKSGNLDRPKCPD